MTGAVDTKIRSVLLGAGLLLAVAVPLAAFMVARGRAFRDLSTEPTVSFVELADLASAMALDPAGDRVAYVTEAGSELRVVDLRTNEASAWLTGLVAPGVPRWSPDGEQILLAVHRVGLRELTRVSPAGRLGAWSVAGVGPAAYDFARTPQSVALACCDGQVYVGPTPETAGEPESRGVLDLPPRGDLLEIVPAPDGIALAVAAVNGDSVWTVDIVRIDGAMVELAAILRLADGVVGIRNLRWGRRGDALFFVQDGPATSQVIGLPFSSRRFDAGRASVVWDDLPVGTLMDIHTVRGRMVLALPAENRLRVIDNLYPGRRTEGPRQ